MEKPYGDKSSCTRFFGHYVPGVGRGFVSPPETRTVSPEATEKIRRIIREGGSPEIDLDWPPSFTRLLDAGTESEIGKYAGLGKVCFPERIAQVSNA